jgi:hypothetical protein
MRPVRISRRRWVLHTAFLLKRYLDRPQRSDREEIGKGIREKGSGTPDEAEECSTER